MDSPPPETPEPRQASIQDPPPSADPLAQPSAEQPPSGLPENPACTECASREVQPSRSVYPLDHTRIGGEDKSFWRCSNCGARFLAQKAPEGEKRRRRSKHDPLEGAIQRSRKQKQWIFPLLVVLATILAVMYVLDRRSAEAPAFTFPDR
jgi:hypothetical protein